MHDARRTRGLKLFHPGRILFLLAFVLPFLLATSEIFATTYYWNRNAALANDKEFNKAYNWTSNADGTGTYPASDKDDDFASDNVGSNGTRAWTYLDSVTDGNSSYSVSSGQLNLVGRGADTWQANNKFKTIYRKDIVGNFFVSVKIVSQTNTDAYAKAGIMVANDITNLPDGGYATISMTPGHGVNFNYNLNGTSGQMNDYLTETASQSYPIWLGMSMSGTAVTFWYKTAVGNAWTNAGTVTMQGTKLRHHIALYSSSHNTGSNCTAVFDDFQGNGVISTSGLDLSMNGTGSNSDASATVSSNLSINTLDLTNYTGTLDFGSDHGLFGTYYDNQDLTGTSVARVDTMAAVDWAAATPAAGLGADQWTVFHEGYVTAKYSETYTFYCKSDDGCRLWVNNQLVVDKWVDQSSVEWSGAMSTSFTAGQQYKIVEMMYDNGGNAFEQIKWSSTSQAKECIPTRSLTAGHLTVTGTGTAVNMPSGTVTASNGLLEFSAASGTQSFVPRSGQNMPQILHSGAGTLKLVTNALSTIGFYQSAGTFDFNSLNLSTVASGTNRGDLQIWNGGTSTFANLSGRTISVAGNASISGSAGNLVNMNTGSNHNMNVTGRYSLEYANLQNSTSSITAGIALKSTNSGSNSNYTYTDGTFYWNRNDIITSSTNAQRTYNWTSNADGTGFRPDGGLDWKFADQSLASGWTFKDVDNDEATGSYAFSGGQLLMSARGGDMYANTNQFAVMYRSDLAINNDYFDVTVKITAQSNSDGWGKAGIVMANDLSNLASGGYAYMCIAPSNNFAFLADVNGNIGEIDGGSGTGALSFPCWIRLVRNSTGVSGYYRTSQSSAWTQSNSTIVPQGIVSGTASQVGLFVCSHNAGTAMSVVFDDFEGGGQYISATDNILSFNGTGAAADANSTLQDPLEAKSIDFTNYSGSIAAGSGTFVANTGNITMVTGMTWPEAGSFSFTGSGAQTLTIKSGATLGSLSKSGAGTLTIGTNAFNGGVVTQSGGTLDWGSGFSHTITGIATSGSATMTMGNNTFTVSSGNTDFSGLGTLNTSSGVSLTYSAASGTQILTPKSGATHPNVTHSGAGTLQLSTNTLICRSFANSGGILDLNGADITTNYSGNFSITNGTASTFTNLGGRTITAAGTASLTGQSGNLLNANPASTWYVNSAGALTASYASLANSNATGSAATGAASNSANQGNNVKWNFPTTDFSSWNYNTRIFINTTSTGANITSNLSAFPLLVRLDSNNFVFDQAKTDGSDLRFMDQDGSQLGYEIERFDYTLKKAEIWVNVPQIDGNSSDDFITMYWGKPGASAQTSSSNAFPISNGFAGTWHLNTVFTDATANANNGTNTSSTDTAGIIARARWFASGSSQYVEMPYSATLNLPAFTFSAWVKWTIPAATRGIISSRFGGDNTFDAQLNTSGLHGDIGNGSGWLSASADGTATLGDGTWAYVTWTTTTNAYSVYLNGSLLAASTFAGTPQFMKSGETLRIGQTSASGYFSGAIDEPRVDKVVRSADWIKFSYESQRLNSKVLVFANSNISNWSYSSKVWINTAASGADITTAVANFPLLIRLTQANFDFTEAKSDGGDLRFTDSAGVMLPYELERYDATSKAADVWVLVPSVAGNNNSQWIRMYWGRPTATSLSSSSSVFTSANHYLGVYHLDEDGNTTTGGYADKTAQALNATGVNTTNSDDGAAVIGNGQTLNGSSKYFSVPAGSREIQIANKSYTLACWSKRASTGGNHFLMGQGATAKLDSSMHFGYRSTDYFTIDHYGDGLDARATNTSTAWQYWAATFDATSKAQKLYLDGILNNSRTATGALNASVTGDFFIGRKKYATDYFNGSVDEVRILDTALAGDYLKLTYETTKSGSTVVKVGSKPSDFTKSVQFNFNTTSTGANVTVADVANIPILIRLNSSNFDFSVTRDDGSDLQFIDKDGSYLYHEVVGNWDKANKTAVVWVKVPQVDKNSTADFITLYYGCSNCTAAPYAVPDSVFSTYAGVWHLNGSEMVAKDASPYHNNLTYNESWPNAAGMTTPTSAYFEGSVSSSYLSGTLASPFTGSATLTTEFWMKYQTVNYRQWVMDFGTRAGGTAIHYLIPSNGTVQFGIYGANPQNNFAMSSYANTWVHCVQVIDQAASTMKLYVNGVLADSIASAAYNLSNGGGLRIGYYASGESAYYGQLNDVRLMGATESASYIKLAYENQKTNSTFLGTPVVATTASFQKTKIFKLNTTPSGANVKGDVYEFPLLLRVQGTAICDAVAAGAPDIRFLYGDGVTWLPHQIERWDTSLDSAEIWVKLPMVHGNSTSDYVTMYYQQAAGVTVPDGQCTSCVFDSAAAYGAVWHLAAGNYNDATLNANNGVNHGTTDGAGVIAGGKAFNGTSQCISVPSSTSLNPGVRITLSAWATSSQWTGANRRLIQKGNSDQQYSIRDETSNDTLYWNIGGTSGTSPRMADPSLNTWHHIAATFEGTTANLYIDGTLQLTKAVTGVIATSTDSLAIGRKPNNGDWWSGNIDEVRVERVVRDSNWIKLGYQNQRRDAAPLFNPSPADFQKTKKYTFNTTRTGANITGNVTNFPLLVRVTDVNGGIVDLAQNSAPDIRFLDGDGKTWLNYQIERWDKGVDSGEVWVLIPQVDGNSDHDFITMYYQQASGVTVADGQCATCVFGTGNGFGGVYHLAEDGNTSAGGYKDATANAYNLTGNGMTASSDVPSVIGLGQTFDGSTSYLNGGDVLDMERTDSYTIYAWGYHNNGTNGAIISKMTSNAPNQGWDMLWSWDNYIVGHLINSWSGNAIREYSTTAGYGTGTWTQFAITYDGTSSAAGFRIYANGAELGTVIDVNTLSATTVTGTSMHIGVRAGGGNWFNGIVDEVEVSTVARSADWIKLAYQNQLRTGNLFWNNRASPNNKAALTATATTVGNISLSWPSAVTDSSNADSVGIWLRYSSSPDSVRGAGNTKVVILPKTDSAYAYPATYPGTYYFALAVRNASGQWSPFTSASSDTAVMGGSAFYTDTVYIDSAIGSNSNSCAQAQNPATPMLSFMTARACAPATNDSLVVRVMPGKYTDSIFDDLTHPVIVTSFDNNSRAVFNGSGSATSDGGTRNFTIYMFGGTVARNLDVKCATNNNSGIYLTGGASENGQAVEGCRIFNGTGVSHDKGIEFLGNANSKHISGNLIYQPTTYGIYTNADNSYNVVGNTLVGTGSANTKGFYMNNTAYAADMTLSNNIFWNWDYGLQSTTANIGSCASNLFYGVTSGREVSTTTCTGSLIKDPLFASTVLGNSNAFKLLPGSPAIDAGSSTYGSGAEACLIRTLKDNFGTSRPIGSAPDIGIYEGTGYSANPTSEFDSLITSSTATTVTVYNSKWKVVFDKAKGGGISEFYDQTAPSTNLLASGTLLFDLSVTATSTAAASGQSTIAPSLLENTRSRVYVKQRFAHSASLDVNLYYTLYPSGHIYVQAEYLNLSAGSLTVSNVSYTTKVGTATSAYNSNQKNGYGYLTTATRDVAIAATTPLDDGASSAETWTGTSASGASGTVVFSTTDMINPARYFRRYHHFLLYIGDTGLDAAKASTLNADASTPSTLTTSAGSLLHERSWQDFLIGHWTFDEGAGGIARDKSIVNANNGTITTAKYAAGKVGGCLTFTASDVVNVPDDNALEAGVDHTYMLWVKPNFATMGSDAFIVSKGTGTSDGWSFRRTSSASTIKFRMAGQTVITNTLTDGQWVHLAAVVENTDNIIRFYVNGVLTDVNSSAVSAVANATALRFGENAASGVADRFAGSIDDVRIYNANVPQADIQSIVNQGFTWKFGQYRLRADNNNRLIALINGGAAAARVQPSFQIDNWYGPAEPKYVYLNGTRLSPKTDYMSSLVNAFTYEGVSAGNHLMIQLNKNLTDADQTLFIDDDDSTGYMGTASAMKALAITTTANDKITVKNFADTVFGGQSAGQWYMEFDLNGWTPAVTPRLTDTGFGSANVWKSSWVSPNVAVSAATNTVGQNGTAGKMMAHLKLDATTNGMWDGGRGYNSPANISFTMNDSSSTRLSMTSSTITTVGEGTSTLTKRWTVYPTGRIFGSYTIITSNIDLDQPVLLMNIPYQATTQGAWGTTYAGNNARFALVSVNPGVASLGGAVLSVKSAGVVTTVPTTMLASVSGANGTSGNDSFKRLEFFLQPTLFQTGDVPITVNFVMDFTKNFTDSATADSLLIDAQTPGVITAITGTRITNDALDYNTDNFAEGDGAYTYQASGGIASFRFVNSVTSFNPAFRISSWTYGTLPEVIILDNQVLTKGYQYNAFLNTTSNEVVVQFNKTLAPGTHTFFISHKTGLAVTLNSFTAKGGDGVDSLEWVTESEFENLGYNVWRRLAPGESQIDTALARTGAVAGAGIANALANAARSEAAKRAAAKLAKPARPAGDTGNMEDTLESVQLSVNELAALGYVRINPRIIPGAKGGSSATTQNYRFIDRSAEFGVAYEYLLESVDFNDHREQFGPRMARASSPLLTELQPNYPNPFNPITTLRFSLKEKAKVSLLVYDGKGRLVRTLVRPEKTLLPGKYRLIWDARDESGFEVPSGQYFYRFTAGRYIKTRKMILVK